MMNNLFIYMLTLNCLLAVQGFAQTWLPVGPGIGCGYIIYGVEDIYVTNDNSGLLIAGTITTDGNCDTMRTVLTWDGQQFYQTSTNIGNARSDLVFDYDGNTYAHGSFVANDAFRLNVLNQEGIWDTVPNGIRGSLQDCFVHNDRMYISGSLHECGGAPCSMVCTFDGNQVLPYYTGPEVGAFGYCVTVYQDTVFVGGNFSGHSGLHTQGYNNCCKIVNGELERVAQGFAATGYIWDMEEFDGKLYMVGSSVAVGGEPHTIFYYENGQLHTLPTEPNYMTTALKAYNGGLYVAGEFNQIGDMPCNRIARWDGHTWTCLSEDDFYQQNGNPDHFYCVRDVEVWNDTLYIGGSFARIGDTEIKRIAKLDMALSQAFPVSVAEQEKKEFKLSVYPNPATHQLNITLPLGADAKDRITIYDLHGRLLQEQTTGKYGGTLVMDVGSLSAGVYFIKYIGGSKLLTQSFVKE